MINTQDTTYYDMFVHLSHIFHKHKRNFTHRPRQWCYTKNLISAPTWLVLYWWTFCFNGDSSEMLFVVCYNCEYLSSDFSNWTAGIKLRHIKIYYGLSLSLLWKERKTTFMYINKYNIHEAQISGKAPAPGLLQRNTKSRVATSTDNVVTDYQHNILCSITRW